MHTGTTQLMSLPGACAVIPQALQHLCLGTFVSAGLKPRWLLSAGAPDSPCDGGPAGG
jgi:hypothetical protein